MNRIKLSAAISNGRRFLIVTYRYKGSKWTEIWPVSMN